MVRMAREDMADLVVTMDLAVTMDRGVITAIMDTTHREVLTAITITVITIVVIITRTIIIRKRTTI